MRYGIISDIHSNLEALEVVLEELKQRGAEQYICPGDIVGYGPRPNECCERVRSLEPVAVLGNHDMAAIETGTEDWFNAVARTAAIWTRQALTEENAAYLRGLPAVSIPDDLTVVHGALAPDLWDYICSPWDAVPTIEAMRTPVCLVGHTHYAEWYERMADAPAPSQVTATDGRTLSLRDGACYVVNPGSVGQPRDGDSRASCALYDDEARTIEIIRKPYNVAGCQEDMLAKGLPAPLAYRLAVGR